MSGFGEPPAWATRPRMLALVVAVSSLVGWGLVAGSRTPRSFFDLSFGQRPHAHGDVDLYREIARRVGEGQHYYEAVLPLQKDWGFPTRPVAAVRMPTSAELIGHLGPPRRGCCCAACSCWGSLSWSCGSTALSSTASSGTL